MSVRHVVLIFVSRTSLTGAGSVGVSIYRLLMVICKQYIMHRKNPIVPSRMVSREWSFLRVRWPPIAKAKVCLYACINGLTCALPTTLVGESAFWRAF